MIYFVSICSHAEQLKPFEKVFALLGGVNSYFLMCGADKLRRTRICHKY